MREKYVYALDLSLNSTGVCIFTNDGIFVKAVTIDTKSLDESKLKLKMIGKEFIKLMREYMPTVVIIEQGFTLYNKSTQAIFKVHGIANYIFCEFEQIYYPATTVKKIVGGKGNMTKEEIRDIILKKYPKMKFNSLDESDAFALAMAYFAEHGGSNAKKNFSQ
jgi:Holliday junction resolvasome RuvABC endonuclease subunit